MGARWGARVGRHHTLACEGRLLREVGRRPFVGLRFEGGSALEIFDEIRWITRDGTVTRFGPSDEALEAVLAARRGQRVCAAGADRKGRLVIAFADAALEVPSGPFETWHETTAEGGRAVGGVGSVVRWSVIRARREAAPPSRDRGLE